MRHTLLTVLLALLVYAAPRRGQEPAPDRQQGGPIAVSGGAALLREPDRKRTIESKEVWLYQLEIDSETPRPFFPVTFDRQGLAMAGAARNGRFTMLFND